MSDEDARLMTLATMMGVLKLRPMYAGFRVTKDRKVEVVCVDKDYHACLEELADKAGNDPQVVVNLHGSHPEEDSLTRRMPTFFLSCGLTEKEVERMGGPCGEQASRLVNEKYPDFGPEDLGLPVPGKGAK